MADLSFKQLFNYSLLGLPLAFAGIPIYLHAPDYYSAELTVSLASLATILLVLRVIDALQDPLIGYWCDKWQNYRVQFIALGLVLVGIGLVVLFTPIPSTLLVSFGLGVFLCTTGFSLATINYHAAGGLWDVSTADRTRVTGWREAMGLVGVLIASVLPTLLRPFLPIEQTYWSLVLAAIVLLIVGSLFFVKWWRQTTHTLDSNSASFKWSPIVSSAWSRSFFSLFAMSNLASAIPAVLVMFYIRDRLQAPEYSGLFLVLYFVSGIAGMPIWIAACRRFGKVNCWLWSMALSVATFFWAVTLGPGDLWPYSVVCLLAGTALGADLAIPPALIADQLRSQRHDHMASSYFAATTFLTKLSFALATAVSLPLLASLGYQPGNSSASGAFYLGLCYSLVPCVIKLGCFIVAWRYRRLLTP